MLSASEIEAFHSQEILVVEDVLNPECLEAVRSEFGSLLDRLSNDWQVVGRVGPPVSNDLSCKLLTAYEAKYDWFQPMDISLPGVCVVQSSGAAYGTI